LNHDFGFDIESATVVAAYRNEPTKTFITVFFTGLRFVLPFSRAEFLIQIMNNMVVSPVIAANPKRSDWEFFIRQLGTFFSINDVEDWKKLRFVIHLLGPGGLAIYDGLSQPINDFQTLKERF